MKKIIVILLILLTGCSMFEKKEEVISIEDKLGVMKEQINTNEKIMNSLEVKHKGVDLIKWPDGDKQRYVMLKSRVYEDKLTYNRLVKENKLSITLYN